MEDVRLDNVGQMNGNHQDRDKSGAPGEGDAMNDDLYERNAMLEEALERGAEGDESHRESVRS